MTEKQTKKTTSAKKEKVAAPKKETKTKKVKVDNSGAKFQKTRIEVLGREHLNSRKITLEAELFELEPKALKQDYIVFGVKAAVLLLALLLLFTNGSPVTFLRVLLAALVIAGSYYSIKLYVKRNDLDDDLDAKRVELRRINDALTETEILMNKDYVITDVEEHENCVRFIVVAGKGRAKLIETFITANDVYVGSKKLTIEYDENCNATINCL